MISATRLSIIFAGGGWAFGLLLLVLIQSTGNPGVVQAYVPLLCNCGLPAWFIAGAAIAANHALAFARNSERVPRASIAGLLLNLLGFATTLVYSLLTLLAG